MTKLTTLTVTLVLTSVLTSLLVTSGEASKKNGICSLPPDAGNCNNLWTEYYYNMTTGKCEEFTYGGCGGNENRFEFQDECIKACDPLYTGICSLPPDEGNCRAIIPMYHYNMKTGKCEMFEYGGCGGNENLFVSEEECREACDPLYSHRDPSWRAGKHEV